MPQAQLEFTFYEIDTTQVLLDLCFRAADDQLERMLPQAVGLNLAALAEWAHNAERYGAVLTAQLFASAPIREFFLKARTAALQSATPLRVQIILGPRTPSLHTIHWETLCDPETQRPLAQQEGVWFSRFLTDVAWGRTYLPPRGELRAVLAAANPQGLHQFQLAEVKAEEELSRVQAVLGAAWQSQRVPKATLNALREATRAADVLYLVCHGSIRPASKADPNAEAMAEPKLFLETESGALAVVAGQELVQHLSTLERPPRLVVLATCQSADARSHPLAALGPRLIEAGVPAVLAMQGNITQDTIAALMPVFFRELVTDGQIDRALSVARSQVQTRPDWWQPVLFLRSYSGQLWPVAGKPRLERFQRVGIQAQADLYTDPEQVPLPTHWVGRADLLAQVRDYLRQHSRLLLTGLTGQGKTALAQRVTYETLATTGRPVVWLTDQAATAPNLLDALARVLNFQSGLEKSIDPFWEMRGFLSDERDGPRLSLLVLDNAQNGGVLQEFISAIPHTLPLLVTSQRQFTLDNYQVQVASLEPPAALALLQACAQQPDLGAAGVELCELLGYHPYALRIAGGLIWAKVRTAAELCQRVQKVLTADFEGSRRSLMQLLAEPINALAPASRHSLEIFGGLAVPRATAAFIAAHRGLDEAVVEEALDGLLGRCLADRQPGRHYLIHDITHHYLRAQRLTHSTADSATLGEANAAAAPALAPHMVAARFALAQAQNLPELELNLPNLLASAKAGSAAERLAIISALVIGGPTEPPPGVGSYFKLRGHSLILLHRWDEALATARALGPAYHRPLHYLLGRRGDAYQQRGQYEAALVVYQEALGLAPNPLRQVILLCVSADALSRLERHAEAEVILAQAATLAQKENNLWAQAMVMEYQTVCANIRKDLGLAQQYATAAVEINRQLGNQIGEAWAWQNLGAIFGELKQFEQAVACHQKGILLAQTIGNVELIAMFCHGLGESYHALQQFALARQHLQQAQQYYQAVGAIQRLKRLQAFMQTHNYLP